MEGGELFQRIQDRQDEGPFTERGKHDNLIVQPLHLTLMWWMFFDIRITHHWFLFSFSPIFITHFCVLLHSADAHSHRPAEMYYLSRSRRSLCSELELRADRKHSQKPPKLCTKYA